MKHAHSNEPQPTNNTETAQDTCAEQVQELKDKLLRTNADFQNFKNRTEREKASWIQDAQIDFIKKLLPIIDNFERALASAHQQQLTATEQNWLNGLDLTYKDLTKFLSDIGVQEIDCSGVFDPHVHEALVHTHVPDKNSGDITAVIQKGYVYNNVVIRPAQVSVAQ